MMISTKGRYALRILAELSSLSDGEYASVNDISSNQKISLKYLEAIMAILLKNKLVESRRGRVGGYRLAKAPEEYNLLTIFRLAEGTISPAECLDHDGVLCGRSEHCIGYPLWTKMNEVLENDLSGVTLLDVVNGNL